MTAIKCVLIPADDEAEIRLIEMEQGDYKVYQHHVGGTFDCLNIERPAATFFVHDEGKILRLPMNRRATLLLWVHNDRYRGMDFISGDVVLAGQPDEVGETQACPDELIDLLFNTSEYRYLIKVISENGWHGNGMRYPTWVDAYYAAVVKAEKWALAESVKVTAAAE